MKLHSLTLSVLLLASCGDDLGDPAQPDAAAVTPERFAQDTKPDGVFRRALPADAGADALACSCQPCEWRDGRVWCVTPPATPDPHQDLPWGSANGKPLQSPDAGTD